MRILTLWIVLALLALPAHAEWLEGTPKAGDAAMDFTLTDDKGRKVTLSEEWKKGPVILSFYRGGWCPVCNAQLHAFQKALPQFQDYGAQLIAVSEEKPGKDEASAAAEYLTFRVLSDESRQTIKNYGLLWEVPEEKREQFAGWLQEAHGTVLEKKGEEDHTLAMPATFIISRDGKIAHVFKDEDPAKRVSSDEILSALKALGAH